MKWIRRALLALLCIAVAVLAWLPSRALRTTRPVGFQQVVVDDPGNAPLPVAIWYPTTASPHATTLLGMNLLSVARDAPVEGRGLPLVVISHGNQGGPGSHADLAMALAEQGFVVAAPMHTGDNYADASAAGQPGWLADRTRHLHVVIDHLLGAWTAHAQLDPQRVGVFGFSAGGFTALAAVGGQPDLGRIAAHCAATPEFVCKLLADGHSPLMQAQGLPPASAYVHDTRIRAAAVAAPGLGFTFVPDGLAGVQTAVQLWTGDADVNVPTATNAALVREALGPRAEFHAVPGASHFSFLAPCGLPGPPALCQDADGFDRRAFHAQMNREVAAFFRANL